MSKKGRRGVRGFDVKSLPYVSRVYVNNQVLLPASLVRALGIRDLKYAKITFKYKDQVLTIRATLLRTKNTDSRQFTIPKDIRERYGIKPGDDVEIISVSKLARHEEEEIATRRRSR